MEFKRLKALYDADAGVHYEGKLCEIISINELKKTAQISEAGALFPEIREVKASEAE